MNGTTNDSRWGLSGIGSYVVFGTIALQALLYLFGVSMSAALMPAQDARPFDVPRILELWWSVSIWIHFLVATVLVIGLGLLSRMPLSGLGKTGIIIALAAEFVGLGMDFLIELMRLVKPSGGGSVMRTMTEGLGMLGGIIGCIGVIALVLGMAAVIRDLRAKVSLPAVGVAVVIAVIVYIVPTMTRLLRLPFFWPGSASAMVMSALTLVRYAAVLVVLWQGLRAIAAASTAGAQTAGAQPMGAQQPAGDRQW